ncbi:hypothetical protein OSTOST_15183 [Ostertagia ostertagi]
MEPTPTPPFTQSSSSESENEDICDMLSAGGGVREDCFREQRKHLITVKMESLMEKKIDLLMGQPGVVGVCVCGANGLPLSAKGSLKPDVAPLASQLLAFCSQLEPTSSVSPEVSLVSDHGKVCSSIQFLYAKMSQVNVNLEFSGGCEFLVGNQKQHKISIPSTEDFVTVGDVVRYVNDVMLKEQAELHNGDLVTFISTLHGG